MLLSNKSFVMAQKKQEEVVFLHEILHDSVIEDYH
jgi:hypothetical protein